MQKTENGYEHDIRISSKRISDNVFSLDLTCISHTLNGFLDFRDKMCDIAILKERNRLAQKLGIKTYNSD